MPITPDQIERTARRVTDKHLAPRNKWDRDPDDRRTREAAAPAVYAACRELMAAIAGQAAPDEALVDLMHVTGYSTAGFSGFNAKVLLLVATDRRIWFCRHGKGSIKVLQPLDYGAITIEQKRVFLGWPKLDGTTITCDGSTAEWLTSLRSGHRQPAPWLQPTQPAGTIPSQPAPANWYPDPYRRSELRYWDGSRWTPHVSTNGITAQDPIGQ